MSDEKQVQAVLSERELQLLEQERIINAELDAKIAANHDKFPKAIYFILPNELCERFCYYGIKGLLNQYLKRNLGLEEYFAKSQVHLFTGLVYFFPLLGAAVSDSFLGKYHTIVYLSCIYLLGNILLSVFSIPNLLGPVGDYPFWTYIIPAILIAIGTGGIKPCVSSHGGDQFLPTQTAGLDKFFSFFYVAVNVGALVAQYLTPYLKNYVACFDDEYCYFLAFGLPTIFFALALIIFVFGHRYYRIVPPQGEFLPWKALKTTITAYRKYKKATIEERQAKGHWIRFAAEEYGEEFCEETRLLGKVVVMCFPILFFWVLYDQNGTEWQNQYEMMNHQFFNAFNVPTEASSNINSILIILLVPFLVYFVYPPLEKRGFNTSLTRRMTWGFFLVIVSFIVSTSLEYVVIANKSSQVIEKKVAIACPDCINGTWQLPQYFLLSLGEAMLSPTGVQFAYTQVGRQMKASSTSIWLLTTALGNYLVMALELIMKKVEYSPTRNWIYIGMCSVFFVIFILLDKYWFISKEEEDAAKQAALETREDIKGF